MTSAFLFANAASANAAAMACSQLFSQKGNPGRSSAELEPAVKKLVDRGFSVAVSSKIAHSRPEILREFDEIPMGHRLGRPQLAYRGFSGNQFVDLEVAGYHRGQGDKGEGEMFFSIDPNMALFYATAKKTDSISPEKSVGFILEFEFPTFAMGLHEPPTSSTIFSLHDGEAIASIAFLRRVGFINTSDLNSSIRRSQKPSVYSNYFLNEIKWYQPSEVIKDGKIWPPDMEQ